MPVSPARNAAYRILRQLESSRGFAVDLLQEAEVSRLSELDRRLCTALVMGVLRWGRALDFEVESLSGKSVKYFDPEVLTILRLGVYQILFLHKVPKAAAVNEAVELSKRVRKRSAAGLINAVLRKCEPLASYLDQGDPHIPDPRVRAMACRCLPVWLFERWSKFFGAEAAHSLAWYSTATPPTTLRISGPGKDRRELQRELAGEGIRTRPGRYSPLALVVESGNAQSSIAFQQGLLVIQDEASQLVAELVHANGGASVLDLCAAPGVKTGQLAATLGHRWLVACDLSAHRLGTMAKVLDKTIPESLRFDRVRLDATRELPFGGRFERILLDAPCSGTGTLARNPEIKGRLELEDVLRLAEMQTKMLRNALEVLAPGGRLVYATCSLEPEENEHVVEKVVQESREYSLLSGTELSSEFPALSPLFDPVGWFRTRPDVHAMDGFFAAVIVRAR